MILPSCSSTEVVKVLCAKGSRGGVGATTTSFLGRKETELSIDDSSSSDEPGLKISDGALEVIEGLVFLSSYSFINFLNCLASSALS